MGRLTNCLYYTFQKLRGGVNTEMVGRASDLLERPWPEIQRYVEGRLEENYGLRGVAGLRWLHDQPISTKDDYRGREDGAAGLLDRILTERRRTSGSSGEPFSFRRDRRMTAWMDAAMWAVYQWHGVKPGDRMARFWGRPLSGVNVAIRGVADALLRQRRMNAFNVTPRESCQFHRALLEWEPDYAYGYPTLIRKFVDHIQDLGRSGRALELNVVITTGELLDAATRNSIEEFFGCRVVNEYGCSESGILAFECREGESHLIPVAAYAEVMNENGEGETARTGEVFVTDLYGDVASFVRYSLGDVARLQPGDRCGCGRQLPTFDVLAGRTGDFIQSPNGQRIYSAVLAYSVPEGVTQFQVRQTAGDELQGDVVVAPGFDEAEVLQRCRSCWGQLAGSSMRVQVQSVDGIDRTTAGKHRYFVPLSEEQN